LDLGDREHPWQPFGILGPGERIQPRQGSLQPLAIKKQDRGQGLILSRRSHFARDGQMRQKRLSIGRLKRPWMTFAME
jgi:hypothetical protein